jgi:hypothetical protein
MYSFYNFVRYLQSSFGCLGRPFTVGGKIVAVTKKEHKRRAALLAWGIHFNESSIFGTTEIRKAFLALYSSFLRFSEIQNEDPLTRNFFEFKIFFLYTNQINES